MSMTLRFHWMLPKGGEVAITDPGTTAHFRRHWAEPGGSAAYPDMAGWLQFAHAAENAGVDSVLISFGRHEPDSMVTACALGQLTNRLKFIVAYRAGLIQPASFVQQINTVSRLTDGRIAINIVAGSSLAEQRVYGDYLDHDARYHRAGEFLAACHAFWNGDKAVDFKGHYYRIEQGKLHTPFASVGGPEIYISGHSAAAKELAMTQGTCCLRVLDTPDSIRETVSQAKAASVDICLRLCLVCRPTRKQAITAAQALLPDSLSNHHAGLDKSDSQMYRDATSASVWLNRYIWTGLVPHYGPVWTALVGTPDEIAQAFIEYKQLGVGQFIISGCPELAEVERFGRDILPRVRAAEIALDKLSVDHPKVLQELIST